MYKKKTNIHTYAHLITNMYQLSTQTIISNIKIIIAPNILTENFLGFLSKNKQQQKVLTNKLRAIRVEQLKKNR